MDVTYSRFGWYRGRTTSTSSSRGGSPAVASQDVKPAISARELHSPLPSLYAYFARSVAPPPHSPAPQQQWQLQCGATDSAVASAPASPGRDVAVSDTNAASNAARPSLPPIITTPAPSAATVSRSAFSARCPRRHPTRNARPASAGSDSDIDVDEWLALMQDGTTGGGASPPAYPLAEAECHAPMTPCRAADPKCLAAAHEPTSTCPTPPSVGGAAADCGAVAASPLLHVPREVIQQQILPLLSLEDMRTLRQTCRYMCVVVDGVTEYRVLWRVADTYREQRCRGKADSANPVISLIHDTICVKPPPAVPPSHLAEAAVSYYSNCFPQLRPAITTATAAVDLASVAALVGAPRSLHALLTHHTVSKELPRRRAAAMLLTLRVAVKMGHLECIQAVFDAMASTRAPSPTVSRQSLLAFFDQCLHNGHAAAARLIAHKADYAPEEQMEDALLTAGDMALGRPFSVAYFLSLAVASEHKARFAAAAMERACEQDDTAMLCLLLTRHSAHTSARLSHVEVCVRQDRANALRVLHDALNLDRSSYLTLLPGLAQPWPLLVQMCEQGAVRCLDLLRTKCGFGPHILAHVSAHLIRLCQPGNDVSLQRLLQFLHRTGLRAGISRERFEALAVACCRRGLHHSLSCLLRDFLLSRKSYNSNNNSSTSSDDSSSNSSSSNNNNNNTWVKCGGACRRSSSSSSDYSATRRGGQEHQLQAVRRLFVTTERTPGQQCPLAQAVVRGHARVVGVLREHDIFSADDETHLHLLPSLVRAIGTNMHGAPRTSAALRQPSAQLPQQEGEQQQQQAQQGGLQQDRVADRSCSYFGLLRMLWQELSGMYMTSPTELAGVIRVACEHELVDVLCSVLLDLTDPDVAQQVLARVRTWPRQLVSNHVGELALRQLTRTGRASVSVVVC